MISDILRSIARGGWKTRLGAAVAAVVVVFLLLLAIDAIASSGQIHSGVQVAGIPLGGMTREEAAAALDERVRAAAKAPVTLAAEEETWPVLPADVGLEVDSQETAEKAYRIGRSGNVVEDVIDRFRLYVSSREVTLAGTIDTVLLDSVLSRVAKTLDKPPVNAGISVKGGEVTVVEGKNGHAVHQEPLRAQLKAQLLSLQSGTVPVRMDVIPPAILAADTSTAVSQVKTMISAPATLQLDDDVWSVSTDQIAAGLDFTTDGEAEASRLVPILSAKKLEGLLKTVSADVKRAAKKATWTTDGSTATLVPSKTGRSLDGEKTAAELTQAALSATDRTATVQVKETQPDRTTEQAKKMGVVKKIGSYTTEFGGSENRRDNVQQAAKLIDGTLVAPGEEFDFDTVVGQRTEANGFKTAPVIVSGGKLEDSLGGGICQVSTTLFNAVFFAGLDVTARTNHSLYISHYPKGRDATVSWGGPAFRFRNDTPNWILIKSASSRGSITFGLYGTPVDRKVTYTTSDWYNIKKPTEKRVKNPALPVGTSRVTDDGQTGKQIKVTRKVVQGGKTVHNDVFVSSYPMLPKIVEEGTKVVSTTTTTKKPSAGTTTSTTATPAPTTTTEP